MLKVSKNDQTIENVISYFCVYEKAYLTLGITQKCLNINCIQQTNLFLKFEIPNVCNYSAKMTKICIK